MKPYFGIFKILPLMAAMVFMTRCASSQQGGSQLSDQLDNGSGNTGGVNASLNGGNGNVKSNSAASGEQINNAVEGGSKNNFAGTNGGNIGNSGNTGSNLTSNLGNGSNPMLGETINNVVSENPSTPPVNIPTTNIPATNPAVPLNPAATNLTESGLDPVPSNPASPTTPSNIATPAAEGAAATQAASTGAQDPAARAAASPFKNPHMNWPGKGKVKYVNRQITRHSSPNGPVVGEFEQGEHPLVYQNGNWVELNDGSFVKGNGLSDKGVGYSKRRPSWR
jgi:hypothetical protein